MIVIVLNIQLKLLSGLPDSTEAQPSLGRSREIITLSWPELR